MNIKTIFSIIILTILFVGCGAKNEVVAEDQVTIIPEENNEKQYFEHGSPFYPLKESMEDLQYQVRELKARVAEYETSLHAPTLNAELLKLIKSPQIEHELYMSNGTIIQGKIITENADEMIVQTRIGQLKIDKKFVTSIKKVDPLYPKLNFNETSLEEKISPSNLEFSGIISNSGSRRADFVRIIYHFWETDTKLAFTDSVFISGETMAYNNNVISNASLNPGNEASYSLFIDIPDSSIITYWTREIKFNIFE